MSQFIFAAARTLQGKIIPAIVGSYVRPIPENIFVTPF